MRCQGSVRRWRGMARPGLASHLRDCETARLRDLRDFARTDHRLCLARLVGAPRPTLLAPVIVRLSSPSRRPRPSLPRSLAHRPSAPTLQAAPGDDTPPQQPGQALSPERFTDRGVVLSSCLVLALVPVTRCVASWLAAPCPRGLAGCGRIRGRSARCVDLVAMLSVFPCLFFSAGEPSPCHCCGASRPSGRDVDTSKAQRWEVDAVFSEEEEEEKRKKRKKKSTEKKTKKKEKKNALHLPATTASSSRTWLCSFVFRSFLFSFPTLPLSTPTCRGFRPAGPVVLVFSSQSVLAWRSPAWSLGTAGSTGLEEQARARALGRSGRSGGALATLWPLSGGALAALWQPARAASLAQQHTFGPCCADVHALAARPVVLAGPLPLARLLVAPHAAAVLSRGVVSFSVGSCALGGLAPSWRPRSGRAAAHDTIMMGCSPSHAVLAAARLAAGSGAARCSSCSPSSSATARCVVRDVQRLFSARCSSARPHHRRVPTLLALPSSHCLSFLSFPLPLSLPSPPLPSPFSPPFLHAPPFVSSFPANSPYRRARCSFQRPRPYAAGLPRRTIPTQSSPEQNPTRHQLA